MVGTTPNSPTIREMSSTERRTKLGGTAALSVITGRPVVRSITASSSVNDVPRTIAVARLIVVAFDVDRRTSVELPDGLWRAIEAFEGPIVTAS